MFRNRPVLDDVKSDHNLPANRIVSQLHDSNANIPSKLLKLRSSATETTLQVTLMNYQRGLKAFAEEKVSQRIQNALHRGDYRLIAMMGYGVSIPTESLGEDILDHHLKVFGYRVVRGTSDFITKIAHRDYCVAVHRFASRYNDRIAATVRGSVL